MLTSIDAIYSGGVFRPIKAVDLPENQCVRLYVASHEPLGVVEWLSAVREHRRNIEARHGILPDSTDDIHADRYRDE